MPKVSVIVLNWNGMGYIAECIESIMAQTWRDFELIVVDNCSTDGSREWLIDSAGRGYRVVLNDQNLGYAAGNNRGMKEARGEWIALLNNDAVADRFWLERLMEAVERQDCRRGVGMAASKILLYDRRDLLDNTGHLAYPDGLNRGRGRLDRDSGQYDGMDEALFPSGCAGLYRRELIDETGGFDERFFAYGDDADLGLRGRIMGWRCLFVPSARVYHRYSASTSAYSPFKAYHVERNRIWVMIKTYPLRMMLISPVYTILRYALQAWGAISSKGAAGAYVREQGALSLLRALLKSQWDGWIGARDMWKERREIWKRAKIDQKDMSKLLTDHRIDSSKISLSD